MTIGQSAGRWWIMCLVIVFGPAFSAHSRADIAQLISNGSFKNGLAGWTTINQAGSGGSFQLQSGTLSPMSMLPVDAPPGGTAAFADELGPATMILTQDFKVPSGNITSAILSFDNYIANYSPRFSPATTLDFSFPPIKQEVRFDFLRPTADSFSVSPADILLNFYRTMPGDPLIQSYTRHTLNVTSTMQSLQGQSGKFRAAVVTNGSFLLAGLTNISLVVEFTPVPEPPGAILLGNGAACSLLVASLARIRRSRKGTRAVQASE